MSSSVRKLLENKYPNIFNENLPSWLGCATPDYINVAEAAFKRFLFKNAIIVRVENVKRSRQPVCLWRVYYQLKNEDEANYEKMNSPPVELPSEDTLKTFFANITKHRPTAMEVWNKCIIHPYTAVVEYYCSECECQPENFKSATITTQMWQGEEVEIMNNLKICDN